MVSESPETTQTMTGESPETTQTMAGESLCKEGPEMHEAVKVKLGNSAAPKMLELPDL